MGERFTSVVIWIFIAFFAGVLLYVLIGTTIDNNRCTNVCKEKGYTASDYLPRTRGCYCKTEEDVKNKVILGVQVFGR